MANTTKFAESITQSTNALMLAISESDGLPYLHTALHFGQKAVEQAYGSAETLIATNLISTIRSLLN